MAAFKRRDGRRADQLRPVRLHPGFVGSADGSCLIEQGGTRVICTASFAEGVPAWRAGKGLGWVTAEYAMLPASTGQRKSRGLDSRATEIQRLIGRSLRSVVRFDRLGENTVHLDCDVLEADGGTRTAAITGAYVALGRAVVGAAKRGLCRRGVLSGKLAAVSVGVIDGRAALDLDYTEDVAAEVDMNIVMTGGGRFVEIQGTAEGGAFGRDALDDLLRLAGRGIRKLFPMQGKPWIER